MAHFLPTLQFLAVATAFLVVVVGAICIGLAIKLHRSERKRNAIRERLIGELVGAPKLGGRR